MLESALEWSQNLLATALVIGCLTAAVVLVAQFSRGPRTLLARRAGEMTAEQALGGIPNRWSMAPIVSIPLLLAVVFGSLATAAILFFFFEPLLVLFPVILLGVMSLIAFRTAEDFIRQSRLLSEQGLAGREAIAFLARPTLGACFVVLFYGGNVSTLLFPACECVLLSVLCIWIAFETSSSLLFLAGLILGPGLIALMFFGDGGLFWRRIDAPTAGSDAAAAMSIVVICLVLLTLARAPALPATRHPDMPTLS